MSDTALLRRRLVRALDSIPLGLLAVTAMSCTSAAETVAQQQRLEAAKKREEAARQAEEEAKRAADAQREQARLAEEAAKKEAEAAEAAKKAADEEARLAELAKLQEPNPDPFGPDAIHPTPHFSCPSGEWCGSKTIAKRFAGEKMPEYPAALGCPGNLEPKDGQGSSSLSDNKEPPAMFGYAYLDEAATKAAREQGSSNLCCYDWGSLCGGGRPLLDEGRPKFAELERIEAEHTLSTLDPRIASGWLDDARMEHASIASFLRAEAELAALDAPARLREACLRAADDERRHARDCFAIAATYGEAWRPGELPHAELRRPSLEQLAVDTLIEGGIGETIAALMARRAARAASVPSLAGVLDRIAADELEHAALAWQTIAWALGQGGEGVLEALRSAAAQARPETFELPPSDPETEQLADHGRLDPRAKARAIRDAWRELIDPMLDELVQRSRASSATN